MAEIIVVGAGITGITTAYALLRRGHKVTVIDKNRYPAMETSFANGGQLSASNAEVWNSLSTIRKGMRWMLRADAPLLLNPRPSFHKYSWLAEFSAAIPRYRENTIATTRMAIAARQHLFTMAEDEGIDFDLLHKGILHIYRNRAAFEAAAKSNALLREGGLDRYPVTPEEMKAIEPTLHGHYHGGFYTPSDATGDIHKFTRGLALACERHGGAFRFGDIVTGVTVAADGVTLALQDEAGEAGAIRADGLMICAGVGSRRLAAMVGDRLNIYPVKGYSITVNLDDERSQRGAPEVSLLDEDAKIVTSRLGTTRFRVAGTAEFNGMNRDIRADRIQPLVKWVERLFPDAATSSVIPWTGLRPMMPDMMPRVMRGRQPGIFYNSGHGHLGWTLSAATATIAVELVEADLGQVTSYD
jgi:D-amino-acid dehydrogenase